ncbi:MAG: hypothetical protein ACJ76F_09210 [Bacteroidia bacterium]
MRNTTKLKHILLKFSLAIDMDDEGIFKLTLVDKTDPDVMHTLEEKSYSAAIAKAYSVFLKELKKKA